MNSIFQLCPKCNKHTNIVLDKDNVNINCQCDYCYTMNIKEFIKKCSYNKPNNPTIDNTFSDIITDINKGYEHLSTYFKELKDEHINNLFSLINQIESSYEKSYNRNKNLMSFLQILINNYDGSIEMKNNIMNNKIKIYKCRIKEDFDIVLKYYNDYTIIENINIEKIKCIKTITKHLKYIPTLLLLKDKRVASCSSDQTIRIYEPSVIIIVIK